MYNNIQNKNNYKTYKYLQSIYKIYKNIYKMPNTHEKKSHYKKSSAYKKGNGNRNNPAQPTQPKSSYNTAILESEADFKRELALYRHEVNLLQSRASQRQNRYENVFTAYRVYKQRRTAIFHQTSAAVIPTIVDTVKKGEKTKTEITTTAKPAQES